ncbi:MAG: Pyrrolidone-carboxylate peptidase [Planctomycetota bacterium]
MPIDTESRLQTVVRGGGSRCAAINLTVRVGILLDLAEQASSRARHAALILLTRKRYIPNSGSYAAARELPFRKGQLMRPVLSALLKITLVMALALSRHTPGFADEAKALPKTDNPTSNSKPVILLTGFEPFGEQRPPNPSWEGIAALHNTDWEGYRLEALQLPVVWGAPLDAIERHIRAVKPIAVFSFGQGYPGAFAIETKAKNQRGDIPDNQGNTPPLPLVVGDGPTELDSSFPFDSVARHLSRQGFPVRISENAGQYLCEETLYSLETLRRRINPKTDVAFCHVPPLGSMLNNQTVDAKSIQTFVLAFLTAWKSVQNLPATAPSDETIASPGTTPPDDTTPSTQPPGPGQNNASKQPTPAPAPNPERNAVEKLVRNYFKSWSDQRMRDYSDCFAENAVIQEINGTEITTQLKDPFVSNQTTYHRMAVFRAVEVPVQTTITFEAELARVVVYWKLTAGPRTQFGYDHFTLMKIGKDWKIVNLTFYGIKKP